MEFIRQTRFRKKCIVAPVAGSSSPFRTKPFSDTVAGAKASANLYSLIESTKANDLDIYRYLIDLFKALPYAKTADDYEALLPWKLGAPAQKPSA